jgi:glycosyltransferase involved in cell wall biosynthesis
MKLFSVIICTYNRAELLADALESVCTQTLDAAAYEVIVVDNNSTDHTRTVTAAFCQRYPQVRYLFEPQLGNAHARNVGWQAAQATYLAFLDDDCRVPPLWLAKAQTIFKTHAPDILSGPYLACFNTPKPHWFKEAYGAYALNANAGIYPYPEHFPAGHLFVRKAILDQVGGFNPKFGIVGKTRGYDEEAELLQRIKQGVSSVVAYYDPQLFIYHLVRPEKMQIWWSLRHTFLQGRYRYWSAPRPPRSALTAWAILWRNSGYMLAKVLALCCLALLRPDRARHPYLKSYLYEYLVPTMLPLGALYEEWIAAISASGISSSVQQRMLDQA